jgi:ribosomal-protein-alanine N-acetyltransferase
MAANVERFPEETRSARLLIEKLDQNHTQCLFNNITSNRELSLHLSWPPHKNVRETRQFIDAQLQDWSIGNKYTVALSRIEGNELIGILSMALTAHGVTVGFVLAKDEWGGGYMTEALSIAVRWWLKRPGVHRVSATTYDKNLRAIQTLLRSEMKVEGLLRRYSVFPNFSAEPQDCLMFASVR